MKYLLFVAVIKQHKQNDLWRKSLFWVEVQRESSKDRAGGGEWQQMASEGLWNISSSVAIENELLCGETADSQSPATCFVQKGHTPQKFYNFLPNHTTNYEPGIQISKPKRDFSHLENSLTNGHLKKIRHSNHKQNAKPQTFLFFSQKLLSGRTTPGSKWETTTTLLNCQEPCLWILAKGYGSENQWD